jgi:histone H3/H4
MAYIYNITRADIFLEFIHLLSSEANEYCEKENKKTISAEHIVKSLQVSFNTISYM